MSVLNAAKQRRELQQRKQLVDQNSFDSGHYPNPENYHQRKNVIDL